MKINNIKQSFYNKNFNNKHSNKFNFREKNKFNNLTNILTKKNIAYTTILSIITTSILNQFDVDIPEFFNQLDKFLVSLLLCINENPQKLDKKITFIFGKNGTGKSMPKILQEKISKLKTLK